MSTTPRDLILYGAGGIGREIVSMAESGCNAGRGTPTWRIVGFIDDSPGMRGQSIHGVPCLGNIIEVIEQRRGQPTACHISIGDNIARREAAERISAAAWEAATVVHSTAGLSWEVELGAGSFVGLGVTISPNVTIGRHVLINTRGAIGHHAALGNFSQVSLGASLLGYATIEEGAMIGAHAVVMSNVTIGAWATVALGTPVLKDVKPGETVSLPLAKTIFRRNKYPGKKEERPKVKLRSV